MEDAYWQVTYKQVNEISDEENFQSYIIASWEDKEDALKSSYGKIMKELDAIFEKISVVWTFSVFQIFTSDPKRLLMPPTRSGYLRFWLALRHTCAKFRQMLEGRKNHFREEKSF